MAAILFYLSIYMHQFQTLQNNILVVAYPQMLYWTET